MLQVNLSQNAFILLTSLWLFTGCYNNVRPELGRSCNAQASQNTCDPEFKCVYIEALDAGRCVPAGTDEDELNEAYEEDLSQPTDDIVAEDAGVSDGAVDGSAIEDAGNNDGTVDGSVTDDAGNGDGAVDGSIVEDGGSSDGAADGAVIEDAGNGDGAVDGSVVEDAGSSDGTADGTVIEDAGSPHEEADSGPAPCTTQCAQGYIPNQDTCACEHVAPTGEHISCLDNAVDPIECQCAIGYISDGNSPFQWNTTTKEWEGACIGAPEPENSVCDTQDNTKECSCPQGYEGTIEWSEFDWEGQCTLVVCPENAQGTTDAISGVECTCEGGFTGDITWDETLQAWAGECVETRDPYECNEGFTCTNENDFDAVMGRDHFCNDFGHMNNLGCMSDDDCDPNYFCLEGGADSHCAQPCGDIIPPEALRVEDRPGNILPPEESGKVIWNEVNDATAYQITVRPTNSTTATTYTVEPSNDSLPTDFTIDGNAAHTAGTTLEVCVAAKVGNDISDDACIFVFFAQTWELPDCNVPDQPQLPKLDPGHAYNLPSNWNLGDEEQTWFLALSLKGNDPSYSPTNIITFENYIVRAEGLSTQQDGSNPSPSKTRWTLQATTQAGSDLTASVEVEIPGNVFQRLHVEQTAVETHIYISDTDGEKMETLFELELGHLGKAISIGKVETDHNPGNSPFFLGHVLTTINDVIYRYKMEEISDQSSTIPARDAQGDTITGFVINMVNTEGTPHVIAMAPFCGQGGTDPNPGQCPTPPNNNEVNYAVSLNVPNAKLQMNLAPTTFGDSPDSKQFTGAFYFRADPGAANDNSPKHVLRIGDVNNPSNLVAELIFQRTVKMRPEGDEDIFAFSLIPFNQSNGAVLCDGDAEEPAQVDIEMDHEAPGIIPIIFSYQSSDPIKLALWVDGGVIEIECDRDGAPTTPNVQKWTFGGSQTNNGAPGFGIDDLRLFAGYHQLEALTDNEPNTQETNLCFIDDYDSICPDVYDYFPFDLSMSHDEMTCATRFESDASMREAVGHHIEKQNWND